MKWCDGSYLEDQDKFRMSGIFRDVYILKRPKQAISDYHIKTRIEDMLAKVEIEMKFYFPLNVKISIEDRNGAVVALGSIAEEGTAVLEIASPELWNTENPYLYKLILETENEVIVDHIALRLIFNAMCLYRYGFSVFQSSGLAISNTAVPSSAILPSATTAPFLSSIEIFTFKGK